MTMASSSSSPFLPSESESFASSSHEMTLQFMPDNLQRCTINDVSHDQVHPLYTVQTVSKLGLGSHMITTVIRKGDEDERIAVFDRYDLPMRHDTVTFYGREEGTEEKWSIRKWLRKLGPRQPVPAQFIHAGNLYTWAASDETLALTSSQSLDSITSFRGSRRVLINNDSVVIPAQLRISLPHHLHDVEDDNGLQIREAIVVSALLAAQKWREMENEKKTEWKTTTWTKTF